MHYYTVVWGHSYATYKLNLRGLVHLRMEHVLKWNHLEEVGVYHLWFGVLLVDDSEPHNDRHHSRQK